MDWKDLEKHFSPARLGRYRSAHSGDEARAAVDYAFNMKLAEAMMPVLNILEIALRNGIHARLSARHQRQDWWAVWENDPIFRWQSKEITNAMTKLSRRREPSRRICSVRPRDAINLESRWQGPAANR